MRDDGNKKGRGRKVESSPETPSAGAEGKAVSVKDRSAYCQREDRGQPEE